METRSDVALWTLVQQRTDRLNSCYKCICQGYVSQCTVYNNVSATPAPSVRCWRYQSCFSMFEHSRFKHASTDSPAIGTYLSCIIAPPRSEDGIAELNDDVAVSDGRDIP